MSTQDTQGEPSDSSHKLTLAQAAQVLGVHVNTLKNWRRAGDLSSAEKLIERGVEVWYVDPDEAEQVFRKKRGLGKQQSEDVDRSDVDTPGRVGSTGDTPTEPAPAIAYLTVLQNERSELLEKIYSLESQLQDASFERGRLESLERQITGMERQQGGLIRAVIILFVLLVLALIVIALLIFFLKP